MDNLLYTVATDKEGHFIKANDAEKSGEFFCPVCKTELILKKSGKTGKGKKRPHFAHRALTPNCTPETALHYSFKILLAEKLQHHLTTQRPLLITWNCIYCNSRHSGNLLKKIKSVKVEYNMTVCQPDIALFENDEKVIAVVEIVVTHKPEETVLKYYKDNNIILIQLNVKSDKDINELEKKIAHPDFVGTCFNPKCKVCGHYVRKTIMTIVDGHCWKCHKIMKVAIVEGGMERGESTSGPDKFTSKEIEFAKSNGVIIKMHYSKTANEKYLANTCSMCGSFAGKYHLFSDYLSPASLGELPSKTYDRGYHCNHCIEVAYENAESILE
ncbi:MAG: hypothetical protein KBF92_06890 [Bacteroidia bacterium]|nr:hypothetical protein [Bacteroidia bacterium]